MKSRTTTLAVIVILIFLTLENGFSQQDNIRFKRLTINDGLSLSSVYTVFQDRKGFMWFGTEDGLNKYDGKRFKIYRPIPGDTNSLSYKWIELIYEDSHNQLWFGSKGGLSRLNPEHEHFTRYYSQSNKNKLTSDTITCIIEDSHDQLWVGTTNGINLITLDNNAINAVFLIGNKINVIKQFKEAMWVGTDQGLFFKSRYDHTFFPVEIDKVDSTDLDMKAIVQDSMDNIWAGIGSWLFKLDLNSKWNCVFGPADFDVSVGQIENLLIDHNNIWISSSDGLFKHDTRENRLAIVIKSLDSSHSLAINPSKPLHLEKSGELWYGTFGDGVHRIDVNSGAHTHYRHNPGELQSLSEDAINCIFEDRNGDIWLGTFGAGINIYRPEAHKFGFLSHQPFNPNSLSSNFIWSIMECENELLWIGTNDAGLNIYNPVTDQFQLFTQDPNDPTSLAHTSVREIYQDSKNRIWIGTDGGGLNRFYPATGKFKHYKNSPNDPTSISSNSVRVVYEDNNGRLWVGTRSGLNLFNPSTGIFERYIHDDQDNATISNDFIYSSIYNDNKGNLWVGTYGGGLNKMEIETGKFIHYVYDPTDLESLSDNIVFSIYEDPDGLFWIGTNSGLNRFDPELGKFKRFGLREGLPNEVIYGILADEKQNIWLSTNKGICRFNLIDYTTKNFSVSDGLQSNEFNGGAFHKGVSGRMFFGGVYGLNIVDPELGYINDNKAQVVFTRLEILGKEVMSSSQYNDEEDMNRVRKIDDNYFLPITISYAEEIALDYQERSFSIEYAALNTANTDNLRFQYKIEGLTNEWSDTGKRNFISFANMQHGDYNIKVRSVNTDGIEGISTADLKIIIKPPFWKTWWFYLFEFLLIVIVLTFIYKYLLKIRTNKLLRVQNEKIFRANQKLLESENNLKQLNATKDKFFSIISHDLKNPFTSLLSISELMADDYKNLEEQEKVEGIKRVHNSARRIYQLLENLLTWSRAQSGKTNYQPINLELKDIVNENLLLHKEAAEKKDIELHVTNPENTKAYCDKDMISTVIRNLLNNAIKFSPIGKSVTIDIIDDKTSWKISVIDQGIGIAEENQNKVFRIETKFKTEGTSGEKGTGLGLIICKEFVEKNGGKIFVISEEGKGSTFSFTVPKTGSFVE